MTAIALLLLLTADAATDAKAGNAAPFFYGEGSESTRSVETERPFSESFTVVDADGDRVEVTAEGLPAGAKLKVRDAGPWREGPEEGLPASSTAIARQITLTWTPGRAERGDHPIALVANDGKATERIEITLRVEEEWESFFLPGVQLVGYRPAAQDRLGSFVGPAFELVIGSWVHNTDERGPSHGRVYLDLAWLRSDRPEVGRAFAYALGVDLSVERSPWRRWLIPVFGLELGGFLQRETGNFLTTTPFAGAHLYAARNVFVTATAGWVFPGREIEDLSGWRVRLGVNAVLW